MQRCKCEGIGCSIAEIIASPEVRHSCEGRWRSVTASIVTLARSVENGQRFLLETIDTVSAGIGSSKVAVRLSPFGRIYDLTPYDGEEETWPE